MVTKWLQKSVQVFEVLQGNFVLFLEDMLIYPILDFSFCVLRLELFFRLDTVSVSKIAVQSEP